MTRNTRTLTAVLASLLVLSAIAAADTLTLTTADGTGADTYIRTGYPYSSYGSGTSLYDQAGRRGILRFDLSSLPDNAVITSATLKLAYTAAVNAGRYVRGYDDDTQFDLAPADPADWPTSGGWDETQLQIENVVSRNATVLASVSATTNSGYTSFSNESDVNGDLLVQFLNADTNGLVSFDVDSASNSWITIRSKEYDNGSAAPTLELTYDVPEPATMGLLSLGALGLLRRKHK